MKAITWGEFWTAIVAVAGVVGAVVAFIVHALTVRKSALEIKKLQLEIAKQQRDEKREESPIQIATMAEIDKYVVRSRTDWKSAGRGPSWPGKLVDALILAALAYGLAKAVLW
ncbi:hypothetical protein [Paraburkholderia ribeironis]|uniref:hypothetical protein n=1 Tax=Paraburkholderia ribeironis TaxID=1247936 RepID=UPI000B9D51F5|nr:hypothetical protein [Paraburkholderia ribeironis]